MRFSCDECGRSYVASDDLAGRAFRMRCKQCGSEVVVRPQGAAGTATTAPFTPPSPGPERDGQPEPVAGAPRRRAFDPFEGEDLPEGDLAVGDEALEVFDRTPPARRLPRSPPTAAAPRPLSPPAAPPPQAAPRPSARTPTPRVRPGRMLPAEDEAMLGPPGAEDRRSLPRWVVLLALGAIAVAGGLVFLR